MKIEFPKIIRSYIEDESTVPLIKIKRTLWYHITRDEKNALIQLAADINAITYEEFENLTDQEKLTLSCALNDAIRIARNSVIREG